MATTDTITSSIGFLVLADCIRDQAATMSLDIVVDAEPTRQQLTDIVDALPVENGGRGQMSWLVHKAIAEMDKPVAETRTEDVRHLAEAFRHEDHDAEKLLARVARRHGEVASDLRREVEEHNDRVSALALDDRD